MKSYIKKWQVILITLFLYLRLATNAAYGVVWPNTGTSIYPNGLSSDYGPRGVYHYFHKGLDFPGGREIRAVEAGTVKLISISDPKYHYIQIQGSKLVEYGHVDAVKGIEKDGTVTEGQIIGEYQENHVHIELEDPDHTNPLRDLFFSLYNGCIAIIEKLHLEGPTEKEGKYYINNESPDNITIEAGKIITSTKDLDKVKFSSNPSIADSGLPVEFDYHNSTQWEDYDGYDLHQNNMKCSSVCNTNNASTEIPRVRLLIMAVEEGEFK